MIDILGVHDMEPTYPKVIHTLPLQNQDLARLDDEPTKVPPHP